MLHDGGSAKPSVTDEIGGYFGLDLPYYADLYPNSLKYQSARAAIRAVVEYVAAEEVMVPAYVCDSVIKAVADSGAKIKIYNLDDALYPEGLPVRFSERSAVIYVNYFGLCQKNIHALLSHVPREKLIIDNSQALLDIHEDVLATVYSPRKFVGVPDGGLLMASPLVMPRQPAREDDVSIERMRPLLIRMAQSAREGYSEFQKIARSLENTAPLGMSRLTRRLLHSIRWDQVRKRRRENFLAMADALDGINVMKWELDGSAVPMCYPLSMNTDSSEDLRTALAAHNVFVPIYWQDALSRIKTNSIEDTLTRKTLFLPIDQRMDRTQVEAVAELVLQLSSKSG